MTLEKENQTAYNPSQQLRLLNLQCLNLSPNVYKLNAYYLELIRKILPNAVREAIFQLILINDHSSGVISLENITGSLQKIIDEILYKYISYLTVENLIIFSTDLDKDENIEEKSHSYFIDDTENLKNKKSSSNDLKSSYKSSSFGINGFDSASIDLSFSSPTNSKINLEKWDIGNNNFYSNKFNFEYEETKYLEKEEFEEVQSSNSEIEKSESDHSNEELDVFKSLFSMAGDMFSKKRNSSNSDYKSDSNQDNVNDDFKGENDQDSLIPQTPEEMYRWSLSLESSLVRRLRNLSHLINIELIRVGLINSFIPPNLLDAAISGQLNSVGAPSNILKLKLPITPSTSQELDISCILIRISELEFDQLTLRQCRQQITQQRNILYKMIRQQRYWQSKALALEVREQWWKNTPKNTTSNH